MQQALLELAPARHVDHHAGQLDVARRRTDHTNAVANPDDAALRRADAVLELVVVPARSRLAEVHLGELTVLGVNELAPEVILADPTLDRIAELLLGASADEAEATAVDVRLPDDRVDLAEDLLEARLRGLRLGVRRLLARELEAL